MKHTKGPWIATRQQDETGEHNDVIIAAKHSVVARPVSWHDAQLIAAAPELLSAIDRLMTATYDSKNELASARLQSEKAISKAKGDS